MKQMYLLTYLIKLTKNKHKYYKNSQNKQKGLIYNTQELIYTVSSIKYSSIIIKTQLDRINMVKSINISYAKDDYVWLTFRGNELKRSRSSV